MGYFECAISIIIDATNELIIMHPVQKVKDSKTLLSAIGAIGLLMQEIKIALNQDRGG